MESVVKFQVGPDQQVASFNVLVAIFRKVRSGEMMIFPEQLDGLGVKMDDAQKEAVIRFFRRYSEFISSIELFEENESELTLTIIGGWDTEDACREFKVMLANLRVNNC